jgi:hypothetical protein
MCRECQEKNKMRANRAHCGPKLLRKEKMQKTKKHATDPFQTCCKGRQRENSAKMLATGNQRQKYLERQKTLLLDGKEKMQKTKNKQHTHSKKLQKTATGKFSQQAELLDRIGIFESWIHLAKRQLHQVIARVQEILLSPFYFLCPLYVLQNFFS